MTRLHRLVVVAALTGVCATDARAAEPDKLLPATTESVVQVNLRQILDSDIAKKYALEQLKQALDGQDIKQLLQDFGLNPLKDIDTLILAASGSKKDDMKALVILHGKFSPDKMRRAAEVESKRDPDKLSKIVDGNTVIFKYTPDNGPVSAIYAAVLDENTVVAATEQKMIMSAVSANASNQGSSLNREMAALIRRMDSKASIFATGNLKSKLDDVRIPGGGNIPLDLSTFQDLLPKMDAVSLTVNVKTDVTLEVRVDMKDDESAGEFRSALDDLIKQLKPLAQIAGNIDPRGKPLADILSTIRCTAKNREVVITGKITGANIGKMLNPDE